MASPSVHEIQSIFKRLAEPEHESNYVPLLSRALTLQMPGQEDLGPALIEAAKVLSHPDLGVKKVAQHIISASTSSQCDTAIMTTSSLLRNCHDSNPMVRGSALRTLCSVEVPAVREFAEEPVQRGLEDQSAYVRRMAVVCCSRIYQPKDSSPPDPAIINKLYTMIRDPDPIVVSSSLSVLDDLLRAEGGIVINKNIAYYLLNRMASFPMWTKIQMFRFLRKYKVSDNKEVFDIMNVLDKCLSSNSLSVVCQCCSYFLGLLEEHPHLKPEVVKRASGAILQPLGSGTVETVQVVIDFLLTFSPSCLAVLVPHHQKFFCKHRDPTHLKVKKMTMLLKLVVEENSKEIVQELYQHCFDPSPLVAFKAVENMGRLVDSLPSSLHQCLQKFETLLQCDSPKVIANVLKVLPALKLEQLSGVEGLVERLCGCGGVLEDADSQTAWLWLLGELGQRCPALPSLLQDLTTRYAELGSCELKLQLLTTAMKVFFSQLSEVQPILGQLLELCYYDNNVLVQQQGRFYYGLLKTGLKNARAVVLGCCDDAQSRDSRTPVMQCDDAPSNDLKV